MAAEHLKIQFGDSRDQLLFKKVQTTPATQRVILAGGCPSYTEVAKSYPNQSTKSGLKIASFTPGGEKTGPYARKLRRLAAHFNDGTPLTIDAYISDWVPLLSIFAAENQLFLTEWLADRYHLRPSQLQHLIKGILNNNVQSSADEINHATQESVEAIQDQLQDKFPMQTLSHSRELVRAFNPSLTEAQLDSIRNDLKVLIKAVFIGLERFNKDWIMRPNASEGIWKHIYRTDFELLPAARYGKNPGQQVVFLSLPKLDKNPHRPQLTAGAEERLDPQTPVILDIQASISL
ncbi:MAG TPA: hypothetical protein VD999_02950 [Vitreimonas sp.]|nr:hypothetical protein [Vitreimonas sp.]